MLGRNAAAPFIEHATDYEVAEVFYSIQGAGPFIGEPAVVVRLAGCQFKCTWCDADFEETRERLNAEALAKKCQRFVYSRGRSTLAVLTGGEPLRQPIAPLVEALNAQGFRVQVETAGMLWRPELSALFPPREPGPVPTTGNTIVCSPKVRQLDTGLGVRINALTYTISSGENCIKDGLPVTNPQRHTRSLLDNWRLVRPLQVQGSPFELHNVFVQPCDVGNELQNAANRNSCAQISQRYGYRLGIQLNKVHRLP